MVKAKKILFVLADGGRARFVAKVPASGDYATLETLDHAEALRDARAAARGAPAGRSFESAGPGRHVVGKEDASKETKLAFMGEVAARAKVLAHEGGYESLFLAAPTTLLGVFRDELDGEAVAGSLGKDLTKIPDHDLGRWLDSPSWVG